MLITKQETRLLLTNRATHLRKCNEIIRECCPYFKFPLPSELLDKRRVKFQSNFMLCTGILHYFGIKT